MKELAQVLFITFLTVCMINCQKDPDESKPYEFGFTIDGQQHRHEKKDEKGIIQGEFGFITADGIYHVTVYATDENGKFKILSTKNLRISAPLDGSPFKGEISPEANKYRKQANLPPIPSPNALSLPSPDAQPPSQVQDTTTPKAFQRFTTQPTIKPACAGCGYVTTPKPKPGQSPFEFQHSIFQKPSQSEQASGQPQQHSGNPDSDGIPQSGFGQNVGALDVSQNSQIAGQTDQQQTPPQSDVTFNGLQNSQQVSGGSGQPPSGGLPPPYQATTGPQSTNYNSVGGGIQSGNQGFLPPGGSFNQQQPGQGGQQQLGSFGVVADIPEANPLQLPGQGPQTPESTLPPVKVSGGVIHVGGDQQQDIPIRDKFPGMSDGLPEGIEEKDITNLLYKFHYFVGFHGHYEKGLKNGAKIGGYFVNGRDGISRVVTYIADENGYRPKVKFINLGLDSDETPKPETEKTFGLKSFEFVWYPL